MSIETIERDDVTTLPANDSASADDHNLGWGRCPVCGKPLFPRDLNTGEPKAPIPGTGRFSRAICTGCRHVLEYGIDGKWHVHGSN